MTSVRCGSSPTMWRRRMCISTLRMLAYRIQAGESGEHHPSKRTGQNPPAGAVIYYYLKDAPKAGTETKLEILDSSGKVIRKYSSAETEPLDEPLGPDDKKPEKEIKPDAGLNRFVWDLRYEEAHRIPGYYLLGVQRRGEGTSGCARTVSGATHGGYRNPGCALRVEVGSAGEGEPGGFGAAIQLAGCRFMRN